MVNCLNLLLCYTKSQLNFKMHIKVRKWNWILYFLIRNNLFDDVRVTIWVKSNYKYNNTHLLDIVSIKIRFKKKTSDKCKLLLYKVECNTDWKINKSREILYIYTGRFVRKWIPLTQIVPFISCVNYKIFSLHETFF